LAAHIKDISMFGCFVETPTPFPEGTKLRLRIQRGGANVSGLGRVAFSRPGIGMGIQFITIEPASLATLDKWVANLRE
jgi:hypothetical protein